jgi:hypothetical protein
MTQGRDLIPSSLRCVIVEQILDLSGPWVEVPLSARPVQGQDSSHLVLEDTIDVQPAGDEPTSLEQVFIVFFPRSLGTIIFRPCEATVLVDSNLCDRRM